VIERNLTGRVAIVTGAAEGIGFAAARRLAQAGAAVAVADLDGAAAERAAGQLTQDGGRAIAVAVDVSDEQAVRDMVRSVREGLGDAEILINNAGITGGANEVQDFDIAAWDRTIAVNLRGVFLCCRFVLPGMQELRRGHIVNVASIAGKEGNPRLSAYSASKAGVIGFTKSLPPSSRRGSTTRRRPMSWRTWSSVSPWGGWGSPQRSPRSSTGWPATSAASRPGSAWISAAAAPPTDRLMAVASGHGDTSEHDRGA